MKQQNHQCTETFWVKLQEQMRDLARGEGFDQN